MTKNFLSDLKAKKKLMKLSMIALVSMVTIYGGTLLYSISAMKRVSELPVERVIKKKTVHSDIGEQLDLYLPDESMDFRGFNEDVLRYLFDGISLFFKDVKFRVIVRQENIVDLMRYLPEGTAVQRDPNNVDGVIIGEKEKPEVIPEELKRRCEEVKNLISLGKTVDYESLVLNERLRKMPIVCEKTPDRKQKRDEDDVDGMSPYVWRVGCAEVSESAQVRGRKTKSEKIPEWKSSIYSDLGLDAAVQEKLGYFNDARSKTIYFFTEREKERKISTRQYIPYIYKDDALKLCKNTDKCYSKLNMICKFCQNLGVRFNVIGFWRASNWRNELLILINRNDLARGAKSKSEPAAFKVVALLENEKVTSEEKIIYNKLKPLLNIVENPSAPPEILYSPFVEKKWCPPMSCKIYEAAKKFWEVRLFNKQDAAVTKGQFEIKLKDKEVTIDEKCLNCLTRLKTVVEKEDWLKIAVFFSLDAADIRTGLNSNAKGFIEAKKLTDEGILHFSLITHIDEYCLDMIPPTQKVVIIPAYRLWQYGFYMLYARPEVGGKFERFFLAKHCNNDPFLMSYEPFIDKIEAILISDKEKELKSKQFFYIVPRRPVNAEEFIKQLVAFESLSNVVSSITGEKDDSMQKEAPNTTFNFG